jgi:hypothetical protein
VSNASQYLNFSKAENWGEIPKEKRDTREAIKAAADAYLDRWGNPDVVVPHCTPCAPLVGKCSPSSLIPSQRRE